MMRDPSSVPDAFKAGAALLLFAECIIGMLMPLLLGAPSVFRQWSLSVLNCFAGGVFLAAGGGGIVRI